MTVYMGPGQADDGSNLVDEVMARTGQSHQHLAHLCLRIHVAGTLIGVMSASST